MSRWNPLHRELAEAIAIAETGPVLSPPAFPDEDDATEKAQQDVRRWLDTWILPVMRDALARIKPKRRRRVP